MNVAICSDHGGYELKLVIINYLKSIGHILYDFGCDSIKSVDYPDFAFKTCEAVCNGKFDCAILICGTGIGMSICANKVKGIRCALCSEPVSASLTRAHNNANALAIGARIIGVELAKATCEAFLNTPFDGGRHETRIDKISKFESAE